MKDQNELESVVKEWLDEIKPVPTRNPQMVSRGRAQFLGMAVSAHELPRQKGWISIFRKERYAMNVLLSILVVAGLLFGGGATVNAAQDDLPNEPLYAMKTWSEDLSLQFQNKQEDKVNRLMELSQIRIQEMTQLSEAGEPVPDQVRLRLEQHIHQALQICSSMDDAQLDQTLLQLRDQLQQQDRDMERLQIHTALDAQPIMEQTRTMLRQQLQLVDDGLLNHEMFRNTVRSGFRYGQEDNVTPPGQNGNGLQNGQPTSAPGGPNPTPGEPNTIPGGPNTDPGGPNTNPGGPNLSATPSSTGGGNSSGGGGTGGTGSGGNGSGGGTGGDGSGGNGTGGNKP